MSPSDQLTLEQLKGINGDKKKTDNGGWEAQ